MDDAKKFLNLSLVNARFLSMFATGLEDLLPTRPLKEGQALFLFLACDVRHVLQSLSKQLHQIGIDAVDERSFIPDAFRYFFRLMNLTMHLQLVNGLDQLFWVHLLLGIAQGMLGIWMHLDHQTIETELQSDLRQLCLSARGTNPTTGADTRASLGC